MNLIKPFVRTALLALLVAVSGLAIAQNKETEAVQTRVQQLFTVLKGKDWKGLYHVTEFSSTVKKSLTTDEAFAKDVETGIKESDPDDQVTKLFSELNEFVVGQVIVEGSTAYAATSCKLTVEGQTVTLLGVAKMVRSGGEWRWDLSFTDDVSKATETRLVELLGKPGK